MLPAKTVLVAGLGIALLALAVMALLRLPRRTHLGEDLVLFVLTLGLLGGAAFWLPPGHSFWSWLRTALYLLLALGVLLVYHSTRTKVDVWAASYYTAFVFLVLLVWEGTAAMLRWLS